MTSEEKAKKLSQYRLLDREIDRLCEEASLWRKRAGLVQLGTQPAVKQDGAQMEKARSRIGELEEAINRRIDELVSMREHIGQALERLDDPMLALLLTYRYIDGKTWENIALDLHYSYMHITRLHKQALSMLCM